MTQLVGLFGYPLSHSISPAFQQAALDHCAIQARYHGWATPPEQFAAEIERLRGDEYLGANVTIPHKEAVARLVDEVDEVGRRLRAVNTIVKDGASLVGCNTDEYGFMRSLREKGGFDPDGRSAVLLGAGGAARAAACGLVAAGIERLTIANRTLERASALAAEVRRPGCDVVAALMDERGLTAACAVADLIVNATSVGMRYGPAEGKSPLPAGAVLEGALVYDMVYTPAETPLLLDAARAGARSVGGLSMLVFQGAASFRMWTGVEAPVDVMFQAAEEAMAGLGLGPGQTRE
jgi:shikimate dehydrogenase